MTREHVNFRRVRVTLVHLDRGDGVGRVRIPIRPGGRIVGFEDGELVIREPAIEMMVGPCPPVGVETRAPWVTVDVEFFPDGRGVYADGKLVS